MAGEVAPITGPMYQLFIFFMITDPKTTVRPKWGQCVVVVHRRVRRSVMRLKQVVYAPFYALFLVGPIAKLIEIGADEGDGVQRRSGHAGSGQLPATSWPGSLLIRANLLLVRQDLIEPWLPESTAGWPGSSF